jgi:hypothetical protein
MNVESSRRAKGKPSDEQIDVGNENNDLQEREVSEIFDDDGGVAVEGGDVEGSAALDVDIDITAGPDPGDTERLWTV